jgi:general secretion pathway protein E
MVMDGLVASADAEHLGRSRTKQFEHPLELIAAQKWKSAKPPHKLMTMDLLVEWLAGGLKVPYYHIDPLKIDLRP